jgi:thioesterase domain-containing protein/acyl carrier protein
MKSPEAAVTTPAVTEVLDDTRQRLTEIWQNLLNVRPIGPEQNYFDLGGDSSLAVHLFAEIEKVFKVKLPLATLFEAQTIGDLSEVIRRDVSASVPPPVTAPPVDDAVRGLTEIWQRLLGVAHIEPNQNYFDLGGDSSLAVHLFAEIEKVFNVKLPLATLFEAQTVGDLSEVIRRQAPTAGTPQVTMPPADDTTRMLTEIWQRLLGVTPIEPNQNYFDLGGDSSLAVHLFAEIEKVFKVKLPLATLFEAQTVSELAAVIRSQAPVVVAPSAAAVAASGWSSLVTIQSAGSRPPLFCMHGAGGVVLIYRDLALNLGSDQPFYGLQSQGLDGSLPPLTRVEDMATLYLKEIRRVQPYGPYFLAGYCGGGTIAYEVAQQLHAQGEPVALLALFDTLNWSMFAHISAGSKVYHGIQRVVFHVANVLSLDFRGTWKFISEKSKLLRNRIPVWKGLLLARFAKTSADSGSKSLVLGQIWATNDQASLNYIPKPYPGTIADFRPKKQYRMLTKPGAKWDELALGGQDVIVLPVYPAGMLVEPFVKHLATALRKAMDAAIERCAADAGPLHAVVK